MEYIIITGLDIQIQDEFYQDIHLGNKISDTQLKIGIEELQEFEPIENAINIAVEDAIKECENEKEELMDDLKEQVSELEAENKKYKIANKELAEEMKKLTKASKSGMRRRDSIKK